MKKITALILALALALSLTACKGKTTKKGASSGTDLKYTSEQLEKMAAEESK